LYLKLLSKDSGISKEVIWHNPLRNKKPRYSVAQLLTLNSDINASLAEHPWISQWLQQKPERTIFISIYGLVKANRKY